MFLKNALAYSGTNFISQVALFIQGFVLRRLLPPEFMGVWNFVGVVRGFVANFTIGLFSGAVRELPILKGKGDEKAQQDCRAVCLMYSLCEVAVVSLCVLVYAVLRKHAYSHYEFAALLLTALLLVFFRGQEAYLTFFQGAQLYMPLSRLLLVNSLILAFILPAGAFFMGLWGVFIAALVAEGLKAVWMISVARRFGISFKAKWDNVIFKRLASYSVALRVADYPLVLFTMVDVLWVTHFMDMKSLAIYVFARSFFLQSAEITVRFGTVFMTRTFEQYGKEEQRIKIAGDMYKYIQFQLLIAVPLLCWMIFTGVPFLIRHVTPSYTESIYLTDILLIASFFDVRNNNLITIWIAEKRLVSYGKANIFGLTCLLTCFLVSWFVFGHKSLTDVAWLMVLGYFLQFIYVMVTIGREILGNKRIFSLLIQVLFTAAWTAFILVYFGLREPSGIRLINDMFFTIKKAALTFLFLAPVLAMGIKSSNVLTYLPQKVMALRAKP